jgi:hypothetical protein
LTEQIAAGDELQNFEMEITDAVNNLGAIPRAHYEKFVEIFRQLDLPASAETYIRDLDSGKRTDRPTAGDGEACRLALDRLSKDADFARKFDAGDMKARKIFGALTRVMAYAADDGQPASEAVLKTLIALDLE